MSSVTGVPVSVEGGEEEMDMGDQLQLDDEGKLTWDHVDMPDDLHNRTTSLWEHLNGLLQNWRPTEGESIQYKKDLFTLMDDFLKSTPEDAV